ncbi:hypothetical protein Dimus_036334 [Dionaea muscipula]
MLSLLSRIGVRFTIIGAKPSSHRSGFALPTSPCHRRRRRPLGFGPAANEPVSLVEDVFDPDEFSSLEEVHPSEAAATSSEAEDLSDLEEGWSISCPVNLMEIEDTISGALATSPARIFEMEAPNPRSLTTIEALRSERSSSTDGLTLPLAASLPKILSTELDADE